MKKKLLIIIPIILVFIISLIYIFFIQPRITYNKDISIIENKIKMVSDYLINNTGDINKIKEELKKETISDSRLEIELETNNYLSNIINNFDEFNDLIDGKLNTIFLDENFKDNLDNNIKLVNEEKDKLLLLKEDIKELKEINVDKIKDNDNKKILKDLFTKKFDINYFGKKLDDTIQYIDILKEKLDYLKKNSGTWNYGENKKIVFNKRNSYDEYKKISTSGEYELIKDVSGPIITANDITITKGNSLNIKDKVICNDEVDGKIDCKIDGSFDTNKVGSYIIKISATDLSNNTTNKNIKVNVKEKVVVNNNPYYIEVIRNQNVVIVYGLDSNNKYTKIVKVFICSVGKSTSQTPTGTFNTSDKSSWGWLVGNLYGQYYTRITGSILFHSVPYTKKAKDTLEWDEYNKLGTPASKGCVRMTVRDVKWIYDNCPRGTTVKIYDGNLPNGVSKPSAPKISADSPNKGWDPTDPDKNNPWKK